MAMQYNRDKKMTDMPLLNIQARRTSFDEVALGYTDGQAVNEAARCLNCKKPDCVAGCPVQVNIPAFILAIRDGEPRRADAIIRGTNALPAICGRVCPQEKQCEERCVRRKQGESVAIGRLERYAADWVIAHDGSGDGSAMLIDQADSSNITANITANPDIKSNHITHSNHKRYKIAVIGSGPAGLSGAGTLALLGHDVTVFEALHEPGGVMTYGIPEFRLPKALVRREVDTLRRMGVTFESNVLVGKTVSLQDLFDEGFAAAMIGTGAGLPTFMEIPGEMLSGVYSANEYLTRVNLMRAYQFPEVDMPLKKPRQAVVIGGGNVAMDAARCALRLGAHTTLLYRRGRDEMPARLEEIEHALEEGVMLEALAAPVEFLGEKGILTAARCIRMKLGEPDASGRRRPIPDPGSEFVVECDTAILAIGSSPNPVLTSTTPGIKTAKWGVIVADAESGATSMPHVYAAGDAVSGAATVIMAMGGGRRAALAIDAELAKVGQAASHNAL